jgi:hypothetical protein
MARKLRHGNPDMCSVLESFVLEEGEMIVNGAKLMSLFEDLLGDKYRGTDLIPEDFVRVVTSDVV